MYMDNEDNLELQSGPEDSLFTWKSFEDMKNSGGWGVGGLGGAQSE